MLQPLENLESYTFWGFPSYQRHQVVIILLKTPHNLIFYLKFWGISRLSHPMYNVCDKIISTQGPHKRFFRAFKSAKAAKS